MCRPRVGVLPGLIGMAGIVGSWTVLSVWWGAGSGEKGGGGALPPDPGPHPVSWDDPIEVATGDAYQGPWRMNESDFRYVDAPTVALDREGTVGVAWVDQSRKDVFFQGYRPGGGALHPHPVNVSRSPRVFSWLPRLVLGPPGSGEVYVLWQEIVFSGGSHGGEIFFARSTDGGASFGPPLNLSNSPAGAGKGRLNPSTWHNGSLDLVPGPGDTLHVAWTEYEGALRVTRSTDGGESFAEPVTVSGGGGPARGPSLAVSPGGTVYLAWTVGDDPDADIRLARSRDGGRSFDTPVVPVPGPGHSDAPKLMVDEDERVHLVFAESPGGPTGPYRIRYLRSEPGGRDFQGPRTLQESSPHGEAAGGGFPHLALDGQGNPHVLWERFPDPGERPVGLIIAVSSDGGDTFHPAVQVPDGGNPEGGFNGSLQGLLMRKLAVGPAGRVAVVNGTFAPGQVSRVVLALGQPRR